jgi:DnaK suppressor protein
MFGGIKNMASLNKDLIEKCKSKLINAKTELLNRVRESRADLHNADDNKGGDEGDQTLRALAESEFLSMHERLRKQLMEIESALARIEKGLYGICEETDETIEADRLLAIPWTRLSIEGAEIRESIGKKYAR